MKLSIVIVSWNTRELLADCLASFIETLDEDAEVLVVDNASRDGTPEWVNTHFPGVRLIENEENAGFARANNQAIRLSKGQFVLLLNPDTIVRDGALEALTAFLETHPDAGAAGARLLNADNTLQTSCYPTPNLTRELWRLFHLDAIRPYGVYRMEGWPVNQPRQVDVLLGACIMIRRSVLDQIGLMDETYFMYTEEVDLCYRIRQAQWAIYWVPEAEIVHLGGQSTRQAPAEMFLNLYRSKLQFFQKHYGRLSGTCYRLILLASASVRLLLSPLALFEDDPSRSRHLVLASRYRQLFLDLLRG